MNKKCTQIFTTTLVAVAMAGSLASAQPARTEAGSVPRTFAQLPDPQGSDKDIAVPSYEKGPNPSGDKQDNDFVRYNQDSKVISGENGKRDYIRLDEKNKANNDTRYTTNPGAWWFSDDSGDGNTP